MKQNQISNIEWGFECKGVDLLALKGEKKSGSLKKGKERIAQAREKNQPGYFKAQSHAAYAAK